jgi:methylenetetrahydrofolate reductase (NADPH)
MVARMESILKAGGFTVTAGIEPPETADAGPLARAAEALARKVHAVLVSDGDGPRMAGLAACLHLASAGIEPVLELSTRDMNRIALKSTLIGAASLGVGTVVCTAGIHQALTQSRAARGVFDLDPVQLLLAARNIEDGRRLLTGTTTNPFSDPIELQILGLEKAARAGARFVITAPVFNLARLQEWMGLIREKGLHERIHIIAGVLPLSTADEAMELRERYCGLDIPDEIIQSISLDFAAETARELSKLEGIRGIHIHPFGEGRVERVLDAAGIRSQT